MAKKRDRCGEKQCDGAGDRQRDSAKKEANRDETSPASGLCTDLNLNVERQKKEAGKNAEGQQIEERAPRGRRDWHQKSEIQRKDRLADCPNGHQPKFEGSFGQFFTQHQPARDTEKQNGEQHGEKFLATG